MKKIMMLLVAAMAVIGVSGVGANAASTVPAKHYIQGYVLGVNVAATGDAYLVIDKNQNITAPANLPGGTDVNSGIGQGSYTRDLYQMYLGNTKTGRAVAPIISSGEGIRALVASLLAAKANNSLMGFWVVGSPSSSTYSGYNDCVGADFVQ